MKNYDSKMLSKLFFRLLPIQILIAILASLNSIIDSTVAGNALGSDALAVIGLFAPVNKFAETINVVLLGGSQILCGQFLGKNQLDRTKSVFSLDMVSVATVALTLTAVCLTMPGLLAAGLGASDNLRTGLIQYTLGCAPGLLAMMGSAQLTAFLQLERQEKRTYFGIVLMAVSNSVMDVVFVSVFHLGMLGLGLATAIANWLFFAVQASYYFTDKAQISLDMSSIHMPDLKTIVFIGVPGAVEKFFLMVRGIVIAHTIATYVGDAGMSSYAAAYSFEGIYLSAGFGIAAALRLLVSVYIGEEDRVSLQVIMRTALTKGMALAAALDLFLMALAVPIAKIFYSPDAGIVFDYAVMAFRAFPLSLIMSCLLFIFQNYYQCFSRTKIAAILSASDGFFGMGVPSLILVPFLGMTGIWIAQILNGIVSTTIICIYTIICRRKFPLSLDDFILMPENFGICEANRLDISVHSIDDAINTSRKIGTFCTEHGIDAKRTNHAALCAEELAGNIVQHGFRGKEKHSVDIRVFYKNDTITIRIKDDCRPFNPKDVDVLFNPEDPDHNLGLPLVKHVAKDITYQNTLGLNVLTIAI